jgi:hypothetical protein
MSTLNVNLINGPRHSRGGEGAEFSPEESSEAQSQAFADHLGVKTKTLQQKTTEIDPEQLQKLNEDFLHSTVALNALHEAYNSASKQNSVSYKGEEALQGSGEHLLHANRELTLGAQEQVLNLPSAPAA